ncbi:uncharacterized protein LOC102955152 [Panthera tigris]|uniref:uncharacterized protein LOC102955152 n=1 Tax=Panthera tigris TaxID=9694 RepID=UPI001C6F8879|nr:uncharacterized protein LOC102955152 [Panthera tigris]
MTSVIVAKLCGILFNLKIPLQEVRGGDAHLLPHLVTSREGLCELGTCFCPSLPCCLSVGNFTPDTHKPRISSLKSPAVFQESLHQTISHLSVTLTFPKLHVSKCPSCGHSVGRLAGEHLHLGASSAAPPGSHPSNLKTPVMSKERNKDDFFFFFNPYPNWNGLGEGNLDPCCSVSCWEAPCSGLGASGQGSLAQLTSAAAALGSDCPTVVTTEVLG